MIQTLQEVCSHVVDCKNRTAPEDPTGEYFAVGTPAMRGNVINYAEARRINESTFAEWTARLLPREGDILFAREAPVGPVVSIPAGGKVAAGQRTMLLRTDPEKADSDFLRLYLSAPVTQTRILALAHGSTTPHLRVADVRSFPVDLPTLNEQKAIATVLCALEDKIAANTKLTRVTEELLQASYRGLIATGPSQQVLVESLIQRITPNRKFVKDELLTQGDFPVFDQSEVGFLGYLNGEGFLDANAEHPILYFGDHTCKLRIAAERFTVGPNTIPFTGSGIPSLALYCALNGLQNHEEYKRHWQLLLKKEVEIPGSLEATDFASRYGHLLNVIKSANRENTLLRATRDTLLPQLMSGKLLVRDAEKVLENAGV